MEPAWPPRPELSAARLEELEDALARTESADSVAKVIAERGAAGGASFANVAVLDPGTDASARMYHASSLREEFQERYSVIPADGSTPLGTVLQTAAEVWLPSLSEAAASYPGMVADFTSAGVAAAASLPLTDGQQRVIGALGMAWPAAQAFTDAQKSEVRVIARLAASALRRAQQLEAERAARQRTERLQAMMRALVASASLADVHAAVFQHGLLPFGASAARLVLTGQDQLGRPLTVSAVGMAEPALTEWRDLPLSAYSPSRKALVTSEVVYVPTQADLRREFPNAKLIGKTPHDQAWAAVPLRRAGRTLACSPSSLPGRTRWTRSATRSPWRRWDRPSRTRSAGAPRTTATGTWSRRYSAACWPGPCPSSRARGWERATCRPRRATAWGVTGTTPSRCPAAG